MDDELRAFISAVVTRKGYGYDQRRKWRLFYSASLRHVLAALPPGSVAEAIEASVEFAEWWSFADLEDEGLDERSLLLQSYDRRQLRKPIMQRLEDVRAGEFPGTPSVRRQAAFFALRAANGLLAEDDWGHWNFSEDLRSAWSATNGLRPTAASQDECQLTIARDIFGDPSHPIIFSAEWRTDTAVSLARTMYAARDFSAMPILADALQDAGCDNSDVLSHCRDTNQVHVRGCWVVDLVLGKG